MGLLDILGGSRGRGPASPLAMALLGLLAWKGIKGTGGTSQKSAPATGGLGDLFGNSPLGGLFGGASSEAKPTDGTTRGIIGALLTGGLLDLVKQFQAAGKGRTAESWVNTGTNEPITPTDLSKVLTNEQVDFLTERTGLSRDELLQGLSEKLPRAVDELTPQGRVPTPEEMNRAV
ncbi:MAG: DUF937 domain-containing protein [Reyranella sp.]|jgi:uncharacterized protein YidB (DUF937 family)|nr:MAG: DUF937 domain-containing protein [Reyranella sp.]